jgi:hypothetical protein
MPKFAIYFVPPAESPFYQLGTHVLGYDVRGRTSATMPPGLEADFGRFDAAWTAIAAIRLPPHGLRCPGLRLGYDPCRRA